MAVVQYDENKALEVRIPTGNGEVKLTPSIVRRYLVTGDAPVTDQEIMMFLSLCKYRNLNPFIRDVYLIKYGKQPAAMVIAKDAYLKRAFQHPDFGGHKAGIIYQDKAGEVKFTEGFLPVDGKLLGGWAEVYVKSWPFPLRIEVSYQEYVGRKFDGTINRTWSEKPSTMIRKVALVQALREAFPDTCGGLFTQDELGDLGGHGEDQVTQSPVIDIPASASVSEESDMGPGTATPSEKPEANESGSTSDLPKRRRMNKFPGLDASVFGAAEIATCGVTPQQLQALKVFARSQDSRAVIVSYLKERVGYEELSYLREEEAAELLTALKPAPSLSTRDSEAPQPSAAPVQAQPPRQEAPVQQQTAQPQAPNGGSNGEETVKCPLRGGDLMNRSYCMNLCNDRARDGFCPVLGEKPPKAANLF